MTVVLDAGAVSALTGQRARLHELRRRGLWPAQIPAVVLTEALTGDRRRDFATTRLLRTCQIRGVDETLAREAARLRTATGRAGTISAVDAVVAALAGGLPDAVVLTTDATDLRSLAEHTTLPLRVISA